MIIAQAYVPMNRYEMWVGLAIVAANLVMAILNRAKAGEAAKNAGVAVIKATVAATKVDVAMDHAEKRVNAIEGKIDDVRLTIDGGLKTLLETIRAEGHAAGVSDERRRVLVDTTGANP